MPLFSQHTARFSPDVPLEGTSSRELLKRYQPLETLATGGFGSIEICRDTHLRRRVAIKRIPLINGAGMPASDIMDVLREAHTDAMLQHPNIVQVIDFTHDTAYAYLVMEYVDGMSVAERLRAVDTLVLIIFITNMGNYAVRGYDVGAVGTYEVTVHIS